MPPETPELSIQPWPLRYRGGDGLTLNRQRAMLRLALVVSDALFLIAAFYCAYIIRFDFGLTLAPEVVPESSFYPTLAAVLTPLYLLTCAPYRLYNPHYVLGGVTEYARVFNACTNATMLVVAATFVIPEFVVARMWVICAWVLSFTFISFGRFLMRRVVHSLRQKGFLLTPAVIVGSNEEALALSEDLADWRASGVFVHGFITTGSASEAIEDSKLPIVGSIENTRTVIKQLGVEDIIVAITSVSRQELLELCEEVNPCRNTNLRVSSGLYELLTTRVSVSTHGPVPLVGINKLRLEPNQILVKSVFEYSLALAGVIVLSPLLLFLAAAVFFTSPGPIIHRRKVLGVSGEEFSAFKFRTMYVNGDEILASRPDLVEELRTTHKLKVDPRITSVGRWMRRYSLDELPQLFNVLFGQMGLVGPRMISPAEAEKYGRHKTNLLTVKPGITGLWQVSGRSSLTYDERIQLDMLYIRNYSILLDAQILFVQTLPAVLSARGAY